MKIKSLRYKDIQKIQVDIPEGENGDWKIERFEVDTEGASLHNMRCAMKGLRRAITEGIYTKLTRNGKLVMSDTDAEKADHTSFLYRAEGDVLVNGLGMGWVIEALFKLPQVTSITFIEISQNLIDLVGPHYYAKDKKNRLTIICANALTWKAPKGKRYNAVWNDIWDDICGDNFEDMKTLHRRYGRRSDWVGSWCRAECQFTRAMNYGWQ